MEDKVHRLCSCPYFLNQYDTKPLLYVMQKHHIFITTSTKTTVVSYTSKTYSEMQHTLPTEQVIKNTFYANRYKCTCKLHKSFM